MCVKGFAEVIVTEIRSGFEQRGEGEVIGENALGFHEGEDVERLLEGWE